MGVDAESGEEKEQKEAETAAEEGDGAADKETKSSEESKEEVKVAAEGGEAAAESMQVD